MVQIDKFILIIFFFFLEAPQSGNLDFPSAITNETLLIHNITKSKNVSIPICEIFD